jgi:hypothetical protein
MKADGTRFLIGKVVVIAAVATGTLLGSRPTVAVDPLNPSPGCSVFDPGPCTPSVCGVVGGSPCVPYFLPPIGQDLHLTISSRDTDHGHAPDGQVDTIRELFAALRACWEPPTRDETHHGMQMSVRFSFKRSGEIIATPRVTYASKDAGDDTRKVYRQAMTAALDRCTPMPLSKGLSGAIAGRPIAIRFIDD